MFVTTMTFHIENYGHHQKYSTLRIRPLSQESTETTPNIEFSVIQVMLRLLTQVSPAGVNTRIRFYTVYGQSVGKLLYFTQN